MQVVAYSTFVCYHCIKWMCVVWPFHLHYPTRVHRYRTRPPRRTRAIYIVPSPRYFHQVASLFTGSRPRGLTTVPQRAEIPEGFMNYHVYVKAYLTSVKLMGQYIRANFPLIFRRQMSTIVDVPHR